MANQSSEMRQAGRNRKVKFSIKAKLLTFLLSVVILVITVILLMVYFSTSDIVLKKSEAILTTSTQSVVNKVEAWMNETITALEQQRDTLSYFSMDQTQELDYVKHTVDQYEAFPAGIYIATTDGKLTHASFVPAADYNVFEKPWYQDGLVSEQFILGSVYFDSDSQSNVVGASGVLKDKNGRVRGVAAADIYLDAISEIVKEVQLEKTGGMFLVDTKTGTIIGHKDAALVGTALAAQEDGMYQHAALLIESKTMGLQTYTNSNGNQIYLDMEQVPNSNWVAVAYVPNAEVMNDLNVLTWTIVIIAVASIAVLWLIIVLLIGGIIGKPIKEIDHVARRIAEGKLNEAIKYRSGDEFGTLAVNFNRTVTRLREYVNYIDEISKVLNEIADGNLAFELTYEYAGEFSKVKDSLLYISESLNNTMGKINQASNQVTSGSEQVASGSQALSQGATEQASSVEELAATINEVSVHIRKNAANAQDARSKSTEVSSEILESNRKMQDMVAAMQDISGKSGEIKKIIKTIEDIAFQTNILALNAAVEAARAGVAGKGFAVVADEVRNLAGKSSEAAKNTTVLLEETVRAVEGGTVIAEDTANSMLTVVGSTKRVTELIEDIAQASGEQATAVAQVTQGIDQISSVVQTNSATAEESAAASDELSGQAQMLKNLVEQFQLRDSGLDR